MRERLQKLLARAGIASRRTAERLIAEGRVSVNGRTVTELGSRADPATDTVRVDGRRLPPAPAERVYLALHKPRGYVTTLRDPEGRPCVRDLLSGIPVRVFPVGRLDFQSEGLLLLTNDGWLAHVLMHPRNAVPKTYVAKVRGVPGEDALRRLEAGVVLGGRRSLPAEARLLRRGARSLVELTLVEGRRHQVRDMLAAVGHPVLRLVRVAYGGVRLGRLPPGRYRRLGAEEVARLMSYARAGRPGPGRDRVIA